MIIELNAVSLAKQKITSDYGVSLEINPLYVRYRLHFLADEPASEDDLDLPWKNDVETNFGIVAMKKSISGIEMTLAAEGKRWQVCILVAGFGQDIKIFFKKSDEYKARELFSSLLNYLADGNQD